MPTPEQREEWAEWITEHAYWGTPTRACFPVVPIEDLIKRLNILTNQEGEGVNKNGNTILEKYLLLHGAVARKQEFIDYITKNYCNK